VFQKAGFCHREEHGLPVPKDTEQHSFATFQITACIYMHRAGSRRRNLERQERQQE
jgi:hypothetical protein